MKWIELETVLNIHNLIIESTGGSYGLRDKNILESALHSPLATFDGKDLYPNIVKKVAILLLKITINHPFVDGNKRTAFVTALTILASNGYEFNCRQEEIVRFMMEVAKSKSSYEQICQWLMNYLEYRSLSQ